MDRGAWQGAVVHGVTRSQTQLKRLSTQYSYLEVRLRLFFVYML